MTNVLTTLIQLLVVGIDDLAAARRELKDVEACWKGIGLELGIRVLRLDAIETEATECMERLTKMLTMWLRLDYSFEKYQRPSWRRLVEAVAQPTGGGNPCLAMEIAQRHQGSNPSNHTTLGQRSSISVSHGPSCIGLLKLALLNNDTLSYTFVLMQEVDVSDLVHKGLELRFIMWSY